MDVRSSPIAAAGAAVPGKLDFMIFTPTRTGSTTLQRLLNCHPAVHCVWEPFNPTHGAIAGVGREIRDFADLEAALQHLSTRSNGFKHVWRPGGFPFPEGSGLNDRMLLRGDSKVIMLGRRNALQRAISEHISKQMRIWTIDCEAHRQRIEQHVFQPLDIEMLREDMAVVRAEERRLLALIAC